MFYEVCVETVHSVCMELRVKRVHGTMSEACHGTMSEVCAWNYE